MDVSAPVDVDQLLDEADRLEARIAQDQADLRRIYDILGLAPLRVISEDRPTLYVVA